MLKEAICHISDSSYAYALDMETLALKLRTKKDDMKEVILYYGDRYYNAQDVKMFPLEMKVTYRDDMYDYYEIVFRPGFNKVCYYFKLTGKDGEEKILSQERLTDEIPDHRNRYYLFSYICRGDLYKKGEWWEDAIFYQIFIDRFNKENKDASWYKLPKADDVYGGNLRGIINKLDYIKDLGINCIYLTPIFESESSHKYDTIDYYKIDRNFGDEKTFKYLVDKCHKMGIRIVLDAVFNHTSDKFFAFKDIKEKGEKSKYYDWYFVNDIKAKDYETFGIVKSMPKLNTTNKDVVDYLCNVAKYWVKEYDIDGWRLDVANEISHKFWRRFREEVKSVKEDAIIIGEVWDGGESYLQGDQYDSTMNYQFMYLSLSYFARKKIDLKTFDFFINNLYVRYKKYTRNILLNLFDSHDTSRILYECGQNKDKLKMAVFFQMTSAGIPMIFYGDEVGITGGDEPDCRRTINFKSIDESLLNFYKKMIKIRKENKAIRSGEFKTVYVSENVYAYSRYTEDQEIICIFNNGEEQERVFLNVDGCEYQNLMDNQKYQAKDGVLTFKTNPGEKYVLKK